MMSDFLLSLPKVISHYPFPSPVICLSASISLPIIPDTSYNINALMIQNIVSFTFVNPSYFSSTLISTAPKLGAIPFCALERSYFRNFLSQWFLNLFLYSSTSILQYLHLYSLELVSDLYLCKIESEKVKRSL